MGYPIPHWHHSRTKLNFDALDIFKKISTLTTPTAVSGDLMAYEDDNEMSYEDDNEMTFE